MPLLMSPIDGAPMKQIHRYGIEIDVCPTSGGIWLDKGELEKLMTIMQEDSRRDSANFYPQNPKHRDHDHDDDHDDHYSNQRGHDGPHKKGKMSRIMEIFDF